MDKGRFYWMYLPNKFTIFEVEHTFEPRQCDEDLFKG